MEIERFNLSDLAINLQTICDTLEIKYGRIVDLKRLLENRNFRFDEQLKQQEFAVNEAWEIVSIYDYWHAHWDNFENLQERITRIFRTGPTHSEFERTDSNTNRPRNDGFAYLLAGKLIIGGISVISVDGLPRKGSDYASNADIIINLSDKLVRVECKRIFQINNLAQRIKEGCKQIIESGHEGAVSIDCSRIVRNSWHHLVASDSVNAEKYLFKTVHDLVSPHLDQVDGDKVGLIAFARVPGRIKEKESTATFSIATWIFFDKPAAIIKPLGNAMGAVSR